LESRSQDSILDEAQIPFLDGSSAPAGKRDSKKVHILGAIGGGGSVDSAGNYIVSRDQCEAECNLLDLMLHQGYGKLLVSTNNLIPDSDLLTTDAGSWSDQSSGILTYSAGAAPSGGGKAINYIGTGAASGSKFKQSLPINVVPGQVLTLSGYLDARQVTVGNIGWFVFDAALSLSLASAMVTAGTQGRGQATFTISAGVYQIVVLAHTNNATIANTQLAQWYAPQLIAGTQLQPYVSSALVRYLMAQKQKFSATYPEGASQITAEIDIMLLAQDPRWLSLRTNATALQTNNQSPAVMNAGNALSYPKFTLRVTANNASLAVAAFPGAGTGYVQVMLTKPGGFILGDIVVVDCDPRNRANAITVNGTNHLEYLGTTGITNTLGNAAMFPYMIGGTNTLQATSSSNVGFNWTATWSDAWSF